MLCFTNEDTHARAPLSSCIYVHVSDSFIHKKQRCHWAIAVPLSKATCRYLYHYSSTQMGNRRLYKYVNHIFPSAPDTTCAYTGAAAMLSIKL